MCECLSYLLTYLLTTENVYGFSLRFFIIHLGTTGAPASSPRSMLAVHECIAYGDIDALSDLHSGSFSLVLIDKTYENEIMTSEIQSLIHDICSPYFMALFFGEEVIARNMWKHCFLTSSDLHSLRRHQEFRELLARQSDKEFYKF